MKKALLITLAILVAEWAPGLVWAQGFMGQPGVMCQPACESPCESGFGAGVPRFYGGYLDSSDLASYGFDTDGVGVGGITALDHSFPLRGLWLGAGGTIELGDGLGAMVGGSYLVPADGSSEEVYNDGVGDLRRSWESSVQWWTLEGAGTYAFLGTTVAMAGFRYDSFRLDFHDPEDATFATSRPSDEADVTIQGYLPFVGMMAVHDVNPSYVRAGLIGFPVVLGHVDYKQTFGGIPARLEGSGDFNAGYFVEAFAEYSRTVSSATVGVFARWSMIHAEADADLDATGFGSDTFRFTMDRRVWILGGSIGYDFSSGI